jgi:hypothetical protein
MATGFVIVQRGTAADQKAQIQSAVLQLADKIAQKDPGVPKEANELAARVDDLGDVMDMMKLRKQKGVGIGPKVGGKSDDGIEAKLINLGKHAPRERDVTADADHWAHAAYIAAAIAEIAQQRCPVKAKQGKKDPAKWAQWSKNMETEALDWAAACQAKSPQEIQRAATKLDSTCNACHAAFRD